MRTRLTYEDLIVINPGVSIDQYTFRGNSDYDPDYTSGGHRYRYGNIYAQVYSKYRIYGSKITIDVINNAVDSAVIFSILPHSDVVTASTWQQVAELPQAKVSKAVPTTQHFPMRLSHAVSVKEAIGLQKGEINDDDYAALTGSNPVQIMYWNVGFYSLDLRSNLNLSFRVRLECDICFYDRLDAALSVKKDPELNHQKRPRQIAAPTITKVEIIETDEIVTVYEPQRRR
jgi:hypothetical protein